MQPREEGFTAETAAADDAVRTLCCTDVHSGELALLPRLRKRTLKLVENTGREAEVLVLVVGLYEVMRQRALVIACILLGVAVHTLWSALKGERKD